MIAGFGDAQIVKHLDGKLEIRGGTESEKAQAHEWMKQFLTQADLIQQLYRRGVRHVFAFPAITCTVSMTSCCAAGLIDRVLCAAERYKRPVSLELPRDMVS